MRYFLRVLVSAAKHFNADECFYKASALTYYTLLSIVPILAVAFGIAKGMGLENYLEQGVQSRLLDQPQLAQQIINFSYTLLDQTHGGVLALVGILGLIWTAFQLFSNIEQSLNDIWQIKYGRSYYYQIRDYMAMLILCPIFFILSSILSVFTISFLKAVSPDAVVAMVGPFLRFFLPIFPFVINWFLFSFIYYFMPNKWVPWRSALIAGVFSGTVYQIVQWVYIHFQIGVASYGAIYGSFAAFPLFLVWLNMSWTIILGGAEVAYQLEKKNVR